MFKTGLAASLVAAAYANEPHFIDAVVSDAVNDDPNPYLCYGGGPTPIHFD